MTETHGEQSEQSTQPTGTPGDGTVRFDPAVVTECESTVQNFRDGRTTKSVATARLVQTLDLGNIELSEAEKSSRQAGFESFLQQLTEHE